MAELAGLIHHYPLTDNNYDTISGSQAFGTVPFEDGAAKYISNGETLQTNYNYSTKTVQSISVSFKRIDIENYESIIDGQIGSEQRGFSITAMNDSVRVLIFAGQAVHEPVLLPTLIDNAWHTVVATIDSNTMKVYLDGAYVGSQDISGLADVPALEGSGNPSDLSIGWSGNNSYHYSFRGFIKNVKIYDRVLTPEEVTSEYGSANQVVVPTDPAGYPMSIDQQKNLYLVYKAKFLEQHPALTTAELNALTAQYMVDNPVGELLLNNSFNDGATSWMDNEYVQFDGNTVFLDGKSAGTRQYVNIPAGKAYKVVVDVAFVNQKVGVHVTGVYPYQPLDIRNITTAGIHIFKIPVLTEEGSKIEVRNWGSDNAADSVINSMSLMEDTVTTEIAQYNIDNPVVIPPILTIAEVQAMIDNSVDGGDFIVNANPTYNDNTKGGMTKVEMETAINNRIVEMTPKYQPKQYIYQVPDLELLPIVYPNDYEKAESIGVENLPFLVSINSVVSKIFVGIAYKILIHSYAGALVQTIAVARGSGSVAVSANGKRLVTGAKSYILNTVSGQYELEATLTGLYDVNGQYLSHSGKVFSNYDVSNSTLYEIDDAGNVINKGRLGVYNKGHFYIGRDGKWGIQSGARDVGSGINIYKQNIDNIQYTIDTTILGADIVVPNGSSAIHSCCISLDGTKVFASVAGGYILVFNKLEDNTWEQQASLGMPSASYYQGVLDISLDSNKLICANTSTKVYTVWDLVEVAVVPTYTYIYDPTDIGNESFIITPPAGVTEIQTQSITKVDDASDILNDWSAAYIIAVTPLVENTVNFGSGGGTFEKLATIRMAGYEDTMVGTLVGNEYTIADPNPQPFVEV